MLLVWVKECFIDVLNKQDLSVMFKIIMVLSNVILIFFVVMASFVMSVVVVPQLLSLKRKQKIFHRNKTLEQQSSTYKLNQKERIKETKQQLLIYHQDKLPHNLSKKEREAAMKKTIKLTKELNNIRNESNVQKISLWQRFKIFF